MTGDQAFGPGWEKEHAVDHADYLDSLLDEDDPLHDAAGATVVVVMSAIAGTGKTVTAINLALALNRGGRNRVVVVDTDGEGVDVGTSLGIQATGPVTLSGPKDQGIDSIESRLAVHASGVQVLVARPEPDDDVEDAQSSFSQILSILGGIFDFVVVDMRSVLDELQLSILKRCDHVVFVADRRRQCVSLSRLTLATLRLLQFPMERLRLILIDKADDKDRLTGEYVRKKLSPEAAVSIPWTQSIADAQGKGRAVVEAAPESGAAAAFRALADLVDEEPVAEEEQDGL